MLASHTQSIHATEPWEPEPRSTDAVPHGRDQLSLAATGKPGQEAHVPDKRKDWCIYNFNLLDAEGATFSFNLGVYSGLWKQALEKHDVRMFPFLGRGEGRGNMCLKGGCAQAIATSR